MGATLQWLICAVLGLAAGLFLLRHYRIWPRGKADESACGGCAHCDAVKKPRLS